MSTNIFFFQAEDGIRCGHVTGVQTCALPILLLKQQQKASNNKTQPLAVGPVTAGADQLYSMMAPSDQAQREIAAIYRSDLSLMISPFEYQLLHETFRVPKAMLQMMPFMPGPPAVAGLVLSYIEG